MIAHNCKLEEDLNDSVFNIPPATRLQKLERCIHHYTLISPENPFRFQAFKSENSIRKEQRRQMSISRFVIHPFSKFREWYDIYLIFLYLSVLVTKPLDASFRLSSREKGPHFFKGYSTLTDMLCWLDIVLNFLTGYMTNESKKSIELRPLYIAKHYVTGPYFICDVLSSIPISLLYYFHVFHTTTKAIRTMGIIKILCLFKIVRLMSLILYMDKVTKYVNEMFRSIIFLACNVILLLIAVHWVACVQFGTVRSIRIFFWPETEKDTWVSRMGLLNQTVVTQYVHSFFKSSAYILGVRITSIYQEKLAEEYVIAVLTYLFGKILVILTWISLAVAILNSRSVNIKFAELLNQLDEYMKQKQLPLNLQERISSYYCFKFQSKYFREESITSLLPSTLKNEIKLHECKSLIANNQLFKELTPREVGELVDCLRPEIYMPNDRIVTSGTKSNSMFFVASGTCAVYTHSGKEVAHLQDGSHFGEICLLLQTKLMMATVIAIETCQVYRLTKRNFNKYLVGNEKVLQKMMEITATRLERIMAVEEDYWKTLFEQTYCPQKETLNTKHDN